jgi:hypothetical protein
MARIGPWADFALAARQSSIAPSNRAFREQEAMHTSRFAMFAGAFAMMLSFHASSGIDLASATNLYQQLGGAQSMTKLAGSLLGSTTKDSRLTSLLGKVDTASATPKVADQLCATLGGGCAAPYTDAQLAAAGKKLTPTQKSAVSDNLKSALKSLSSNPMVRDAATKALGPKLGGLLALLPAG